MADYFIYAHKDTGYFAKISDRVIEDSNLIEAKSMPPSINYKWSDRGWTALSNAEMAEIENDIEPPAQGENEPEVSGNIPTEIIEALLGEKDKQKVIETNEKFYDKTTWQQIPGMKLTSRNLVKSFYRIEIEILVKTSRNNRDFEFGLFINGKQQEDNLLHIDFNRANDDKTLSWSDELELEPSSIVALFWRRVGSSVKCTVARRKLAIIQQQATGLLDDIEPEPTKSSWLFLGDRS